MDHQYIMKNVAAIVCFVLCQCARSVPIQKQSKSIISQDAPIHKRSADTVEFVMNSDSHNRLIKEDNRLTNIASISQKHFNDELVCPGNVSTGMNDPVYKRSTCPWYYSASRDPTRHPIVIISANSLCDYAIDSNKTYECVPITQSLTVLRQKNYRNGDGNFVWVEETITNVIGFTASGRRLTESATVAPSNQPTPEWAKR